MEGFTQFVSVSNWVHAVCGVSPDRLQRWVAYIKEHKYFADPEVVQALTEFCQVKNELLRYQPLSNMIMRVLALARGTEPRMEGLPDTPPVADITFFRNDPKHMRPPGDYDRLDARRKPDVLATRATKVIDWEGKDRVDWTSALLCVELKFDGTHSAALEAARKRKLLAVNSTTDVEEQPVDVNARGAEDAEDVGDAEEETVETASVGSKRSRNSSSSSSKSRKSSHQQEGRVSTALVSFSETTISRYGTSTLLDPLGPKVRTW
ncbi:hypothetical protein BDW22DRAFT_583489 [Trametopsis cervina]|nr:hypothetical protein BDW22DRAFT_583489 [Trametopsis cervina]